jgi:ribosomal protein S18 acetylase RimI-like enzyme
MEIKPMVVMITVRRAHVEDARSIAVCLESAFEPFRSEYTLEAFQDTVLTIEAIRERMIHMAVYVAITPDGEIVGTLAATLHGSEGHLRGMAVRPAWQGNSIAENLLRTAEQDLQAAGCVRLTLDTTAPLQRAISFYKRSGFAPSGRIADFFGMPLHEYLKQLPSLEKSSSKARYLSEESK